MSDLFELRVVGVVGATMRVHARSVHPDQHDVPRAKNFALQIVVELYWSLREGYTRGGDVSKHPRRGELESLLDDMHGVDEPITKQEHDRLRAMPGRTGYSVIGMRRVGDVEHHYANRGTDHVAFRAAADARVITLDLDDERNNPGPRAEAIVVATFTDAALLVHLTPGLTWASAIYDFTGW